MGRSAAITTLVTALWTFIDDTMTAIAPQRGDPVRPDRQSLRIVLVASVA
jgi:hypothetical protein